MTWLSWNSYNTSRQEVVHFQGDLNLWSSWKKILSCIKKSPCKVFIIQITDKAPLVWGSNKYSMLSLSLFECILHVAYLGQMSLTFDPNHDHNHVIAKQELCHALIKSLMYFGYHTGHIKSKGYQESCRFSIVHSVISVMGIHRSVSSTQIPLLLH